LSASPDTVSRRIAELKDELGFGNFMLVTGFLGNLGQERVVATLELFARKVMPHFVGARQIGTGAVRRIGDHPFNVP
jgi:hypothetical protein